MSLPTNLSKPIAMVSGQPALASDVNTDLDYIVDALNTTNGEVNTRTQDLVFSGTGRRIIGDMSNATIANRLAFQNSNANTASTMSIIPNGSAAGTSLHFIADSAATNASRLIVSNNNVNGFIRMDLIGSGANARYLPFAIETDGGTAIYCTASTTSTPGNNPLVLIRATSTTDSVTPLQVTGAIKHSVYTVATLPTGTAGCRSFVSDASATLAAGHGNIVAGGGANFCPVYHDGTNWRIG